jgi:aminoacrylate hydrolase
VHYEIHGRRDAAPTVVLCSGLGGVAHYWAPQIPTLARHFRVIAYDQHGTGESGGAIPEGYAIKDMAAEVATLLAELAVEKCHFVGHALGGLIGLHLAVDRPALVDRLIVVNAWLKTHPHTLRCFAVRRSLLLDTGPEAYVRAQPLFLYPAAWLADRQVWLAEQDAAGMAHFPPTENLLRRIAAIEAFDLTAKCRLITAPTLVIATRDDVLVPHTCSLALADALPNAELVVLDQGGHACNITEPNIFDTMVVKFLSAGLCPDPP